MGVEVSGNATKVLTPRVPLKAFMGSALSATSVLLEMTSQPPFRPTHTFAPPPASLPPRPRPPPPPFSEVAFSNRQDPFS